MCSTITWKDFLNEENENLKNRTYTIPDKLKETLVNNFQNYTAPKSEEGYKRLRFLATHDNVSYRELKRLKNFFDTNQDKDLFNRLGGADTQSWVENGLKSSTGKSCATSAESVYAFITNNADYVEEHTALSDAMIEKDIFVRCYKMHKKFTKNMHQWNCKGKNANKCFPSLK